MKIENIKLTRDEKQTIQGTSLLSVSVNRGNVIASVEVGEDNIELAIVKGEAPESAKYFTTLNEGHMVSHVFVIEQREEEKKKK